MYNNGVLVKLAGSSNGFRKKLRAYRNSNRDQSEIDSLMSVIKDLDSNVDHTPIKYNYMPQKGMSIELDDPEIKKFLSSESIEWIEDCSDSVEIEHIFMHTDHVLLLLKED